MLKVAESLREMRGLLVWVSLAGGVIAALAVLFSVIQPVQAQSAGCEDEGRWLRVPEADQQQACRLPDLITEGLTQDVHTDRQDWENGVTSLHAAGTVNPLGSGPGEPFRASRST